MKPDRLPPFLADLLAARSPSGYESEALDVIKKYVEPHADEFSVDALGSCFATLNKQKAPTLMLAGHLDELGLIKTKVLDWAHGRFLQEQSSRI